MKGKAVLENDTSALYIELEDIESQLEELLRRKVEVMEKIVEIYR